MTRPDLYGALKAQFDERQRQAAERPPSDLERALGAGVRQRDTLLERAKDNPGLLDALSANDRATLARHALWRANQHAAAAGEGAA